MSEKFFDQDRPRAVDTHPKQGDDMDAIVRATRENPSQPQRRSEADHQPTPGVIVEEDKDSHFMKRAAAVASIGAAFLAGGYAATHTDEIKSTIEHVQEMNAAKFSEQTHVYVVGSGDTLWSIADTIEGIETVHDKQEVVSYLKTINGLSTSDIKAGQSLIVPESVQG